MRAEARTPAAGASRAARGFTLLEVLVAVLLLGLALTALVKLAGLEARATAQLRDGTFAQWVAANALAETRLGEPFPAPGRREGESVLASRRWRWQLDVATTDVESIHRMDVSVFDAERRARGEGDDEDVPVATLTGFAVRR
jgi:general secretion pathway protein I